jgi:hypothetical protein
MGKIYLNILLTFAFSIVFFLLTKKYVVNYLNPFYYFFLLIIVFVALPAYKSYLKFYNQNKEVINNSMCATCNFFDKNNVYCYKYDKFVENHIIPCGGKDYEPFYQTNILKRVE